MPQQVTDLLETRLGGNVLERKTSNYQATVLPVYEGEAGFCSNNALEPGSICTFGHQSNRIGQALIPTTRLAAILLALVGVVFFGQGIGLIPGSFMTGRPLWAVIGLGCLALAVLLFRFRK